MARFPQEVKILTKGRIGEIKTPLTFEAIQELSQLPNMSWFDPEDLNNSEKFYSHPVLWAGKVSQVSEYLTKRHGCNVIVKPAKKEKRTYDWEYTGTPREGQSEAAQALLKNSGGCVQITTGGGKTHVMSNVIATIGVHTLIVLYDTTPFDQMVDTIEEFTNIDYGVWTQGIANKAPCIIANIQTIASVLRSKKSWRKSWLMDECKMVFFDEMHHAVSDGSLNLLAHLLNLDYVFGVTATPYRVDAKEPLLEAIFGLPLYKLDQGQNVEHGNSVPFDLVIEDVPPKDYGYASKRTPEYVRRRQYRKVVERYIHHGETGRNAMIIKDAKEHIEKGRTVLISVSGVPHAEILHRQIKGSTILVASGPYKTKPKDRKDILDAARHREIPCLISTVVKEAVDIPSLDVVILAMEGKSKIMLEQSLRNTRKCDTMLRTGYYKKTRCYVHYYRNNTDFLKTQSEQAIKVLKQLAKVHPSNKVYDKDEKKCKTNSRKKQKSHTKSSLLSLTRKQVKT